jgi:L-fuculose-phosphate aldolase
MLDAEREAVARACRQLAADGLVVATAGNVSVRVGERIAVTPTGCRLAELDAGDVSVVDLDGGLVEGTLEPTSELLLHLAVHAERGDGALVHTHAPMSTAVACVVDELPCIHYQLLLLGGSVRVAPYATFGTAQLARAVVGALEGRSAALMSNHGAVTHGRTLDVALEAMQLLEWTCGVYWRACQLGTPRLLDDAQQAAVVAAALERSYGAPRAASGLSGWHGSHGSRASSAAGAPGASRASSAPGASSASSGEQRVE